MLSSFKTKCKNVKTQLLQLVHFYFLSGRTLFYDSYGVVSDVMQNHLSEILYKITKNSSTTLHDYEEDKLDLQDQVSAVNKNKHVVFSQYKDYIDQIAEESDKIASKTPTFASALLKINTNRWKHVAIKITAGKKLDERVGYAKITIKNKAENSHVIFYIGHGSLKTPAVIISKSLQIDAKSLTDNGWLLTNKFDRFMLFNLSMANSNVYVPQAPNDAYSYLIERVFLGEKNHFVSTESLLKSWKIWESALKPAADEISHKYSVESSREFMVRAENFVQLHFDRSLEVPDDVKKARVLSGNRVMIAENLAFEILRDSKRKTDLGKKFHIAFAGGRSPLGLFAYIASQMGKSFDWKLVHVWQTDERCSDDPKLSNYNMMHKYLLSKVALPRSNVHAIPCQLSELTEFERQISNLQGFDFIVLGMGDDGHVASLFANHKSSFEDDRYVVKATNVPNQHAPTRATITHKTIRLSDVVTILVMGDSHKAQVYHDIMENDACDDVEKYSVCKVIRNKKVTWFVDEHIADYSFMRDEL